FSAPRTSDRYQTTMPSPTMPSQADGGLTRADDQLPGGVPNSTQANPPEAADAGLAEANNHIPAALPADPPGSTGDPTNVADVLDHVVANLQTLLADHDPPCGLSTAIQHISSSPAFEASVALFTQAMAG